MKPVEQIETSLAPLKSQLTNHALYCELQTLQDVRTFMGWHVYAVWDFMSLLKALQRELTCVQTPWLPPKHPSLARFINEIVLGEESDLNEQGQPLSHFDMYLHAMEQIAADTTPIRQLLSGLRQGHELQSLLEQVQTPETVRQFVDFSFELIRRNQPHEIAAAFTFGREGLIPDIFLQIVKQAEATEGKRYPKLVYYLQRHIEVDGDEHGPLSLQLIEALCGDDQQKWADVAQIAHQALEQRISLWDGITHQLRATTVA